MNKQDLLAKKEEIAKAKEKRSELKGEHTAAIKKLKKDWQCNDLQEAKKKIETLEKKKIKLSVKITEKTQELEDTYFKTEVV